jgi:hypothetical protein
VECHREEIDVEEVKLDEEPKALFYKTTLMSF